MQLKGHYPNKPCFGRCTDTPSLASPGQPGIGTVMTSSCSILLPKECFSISAIMPVMEIRVAAASLNWRVHFWKPQYLEDLPFSPSVAAFGRSWREQQPDNPHLSLTHPDQRWEQHLWKDLTSTKPSFQCSSIGSGGNLRALTSTCYSKYIAGCSTMNMNLQLFNTSLTRV